MTIGDVFARAWDLWRKSVGWLILAGLVVGAILALTFAIVFGILSALVAGAVSTAGSDLVSDSGSSLSGLGAGLGVLGLIVYVLAMFLIQVVTITFYGGLFEMVIGAYRQQRDVRFGDLFAGFRHFSAYLVYALVLLGVSLGLSVLGLIPFLGGLIAFVVSIWLSVIWMYVLPLIADQGVGFMEAAGRSRQMVGSAGWWWTFGMVVLLGIASLAAFVVILFVALAFYRTNESVGIVIGVLLFLLFAVFFPPYAICYVSVLYIASGGDTVAGAGQAAGCPASRRLLRRRRRTARRPRRSPPGRTREGTAALPVCRGGVATTPGRPRRTRSPGRRLRLRRSRRRLHSPRRISRRAALLRRRRPSRMPGRPRRRSPPRHRRRPDRWAEPRALRLGETIHGRSSRAGTLDAAACRQSWRKNPLMGSAQPCDSSLE